MERQLMERQIECIMTYESPKNAIQIIETEPKASPTFRSRHRSNVSKFLVILLETS